MKILKHLQKFLGQKKKKKKKGRKVITYLFLDSELWGKAGNQVEHCVLYDPNKETIIIIIA